MMFPKCVAMALATAGLVLSLAPVGAQAEETPVSFPDSEAFVFRPDGPVPLRLHVVKPKGGTAPREGRACLVCFFGGGWNNGTPASSLNWARWGTTLGMVGVAPDYRTRDRLGGTPEDCVADGRRAVAWIGEHAAALGIDPKRIIALGVSAGGHVAAWTAIEGPGPGKDDPAPTVLPAALVLINPVTDTKAGGYGGPRRFGGDPERARACSVPDQMQEKMPPTIIFHATADKTVPYANSVAFRDKLVSRGNTCELITFQGLGHSYYSTAFGDEGKAAMERTRVEATRFLAALGLAPKSSGTKGP